MTETICISKYQYLQMKQELVSLRRTELYRRLLQFEKNIKVGKIFTRKDLSF